jgi:hypothetical protein
MQLKQHNNCNQDIINNNYHIKPIHMNLALQRVDSVTKPSLISEWHEDSSQYTSCREKSDNTTHV